LPVATEICLYFSTPDATIHKVGRDFPPENRISALEMLI
jgi:hypothetical protein